MALYRDARYCETAAITVMAYQALLAELIPPDRVQIKTIISAISGAMRYHEGVVLKILF